MSKFLILSLSGDGVGLALRLKAEGHSAKLWIRESEYENSGKGIVDCACDYEFGSDVIADCTGFGYLCNLLRDSQVSVFAGSSFADHLEEDRDLSQKVMLDSGISTPISEHANFWEQASKLVEKISNKSNDGKVVIKPEGSSSGSIPSYVASDVEDALSFLQSYEKKHEGEPQLTIQQFVEGVAVSTEGWFNGEDFVEGMFNHTLEKKQTLNDDLGPSVGCTGNVVWSCGADDPLVKETLIKLTETLREHRYVGPIDINTVVNKEGCYGLEFTPRFGYDAFPTLLYTLADFDFGSFVYRCSRGMDCNESLAEGFGAGVRLRPPKLGKHDELSELRGWSEEDLHWFYPYCVEMSKDKVLKMTKGDSGPGVINGYGATIGEAFAKAYDVISRLQCRDIQYRTDLSDVLLKDFRELKEILNGEESGWIAVDLDGTLATYSGWSEEIGSPISKMIQRVKTWLREGKEVRILTARGSVGDNKFAQLIKVYEWVKQHIGEPLEVTHKKDPQMIRLYDDRVRQIEANTGELVNS
jgi:phosphoribosylamine-glycine ligase